MTIKFKDSDSCIIEHNLIKLNELKDEQLEKIFSYNPDWVIEFRSDWVKERYPNIFN